MEELIIRMQSLFHGVELKASTDNIKIGAYTLNYTKQTLGFFKFFESLTHRKIQLLFYLFENKDKILDRIFILNKLWVNNDYFNARSMDVFIRKLRKN